MTTDNGDDLVELAEPIPVRRATTVQLAAAPPGAPPIEMRDDWGALPPKSNPGGFQSLEATVCHYTGANHGYAVPATGDHARCHQQVRDIQRQHQAIPEQSDIEYNALTCNHGYLFEGRVLGYKGGANGSADTNRTMPSVCCLLGVDDLPTWSMLAAVQWFHARVEARAGVPRLVMHRHGDLYPTSCPGDPLGVWVDAGGYHPVTPHPPDPPEDDEMAFLIAVTNHPGYDPRTQVVYVADWISRRWVADERELELIRQGGIGPAVPVDWTDVDAFGVPIGVTPPP